MRKESDSQGRRIIGNGGEVPFHNSIVGSFIFYEHRVETNLLGLFAHPENVQCCPIIFVILSEVNIVAAQNQAYW